jgi:hypothetical protein
LSSGEYLRELTHRWDVEWFSAPLASDHWQMGYLQWRWLQVWLWYCPDYNRYYFSTDWCRVQSKYLYPTPILSTSRYHENGSSREVDCIYIYMFSYILNPSFRTRRESLLTKSIVPGSSWVLWPTGMIFVSRWEIRRYQYLLVFGLMYFRSSKLVRTFS